MSHRPEYYCSKYRYNRKPADRDNKGYYAGWRDAPKWDSVDNPSHKVFGCQSWIIRVPSLKRGRSTWKRFYKLFPHLKYQDTCGGVPLKKI